MCVVCGCSATVPAGETPAGVQVDPKTGDLHFGAGAARVSVPGLSPARAIKLEADVLGENNRVAAANRAHFAAHGVCAYNLVSSPGSGKTTLLCATIAALRMRQPALPLTLSIAGSLLLRERYVAPWAVTVPSSTELCEVLGLPPSTRAPRPRVCGKASPVNIDSSTALRPSLTTPSASRTTLMTAKAPSVENP